MTGWQIAWSVAVVALFIYLWRNGQLLRLRAYLEETREEMKRCTWPTWPELKGSTAVVMVSIGLLGAFTVAVDVVFALAVNFISKIS